jgi:hypothetical protein
MPAEGHRKEVDGDLATPVGDDVAALTGLFQAFLRPDCAG